MNSVIGEKLHSLIDRLNVSVFSNCHINKWNTPDLPKMLGLPA